MPVIFSAPITSAARTRPDSTASSAVNRAALPVAHAFSVRTAGIPASSGVAAPTRAGVERLPGEAGIEDADRDEVDVAGRRAPRRPRRRLRPRSSVFRRPGPRTGRRRCAPSRSSARVMSSSTSSSRARHPAMRCHECSVPRRAGRYHAAKEDCARRCSFCRNPQMKGRLTRPASTSGRRPYAPRSGRSHRQALSSGFRHLNDRGRRARYGSRSWSDGHPPHAVATSAAHLQGDDRR